MSGATGILTALDVECPRCQVTVGQPCRGRTGAANGVHVPRNVLAQKRLRGPDVGERVLGYLDRGVTNFRVKAYADDQVELRASFTKATAFTVGREDLDYDTVAGAWYRKAAR